MAVFSAAEEEYYKSFYQIKAEALQASVLKHWPAALGELPSPAAGNGLGHPDASSIHVICRVVAQATLKDVLVDPE